jgi:hypothetical protein
VVYAFKDQDAAAAMLPTDSGLLGVAAAEVFRMAVDNRSGIYLNAAGPAGGELTYDEVTTLARAQLPTERAADEVVTLPPGSHVIVGLPRIPPPTEVLRKMNEVLAGAPAIKSAFLYQLYVPGGQPHPVVAVMADPPLAERAAPLFAQLAEIWRPFLEKDEYVDFQAVTRDDELVADRTSVMTIFER